jgi:hypothetical protein
MIRQITIRIICLHFLLFLLCGNVTKANETHYENPNEIEQDVFAAKLARIKAHSSSIPAGRQVNDMIRSLEQPLRHEINCEGEPARKVVVNINSQLNHWNQNIVTQKIGPGAIGACLADCTHTVFIDNVKTVNLTFHIMLDPRISVPDEAGTSFDQLFDETLLYHELLHGQLLINDIKNDNDWQAKICDCTFDMAPLDPNHETIYPWEQYYLETIAGGDPNILVKRIPRQTAEDANGNFDIDLGKVDNLLPPGKIFFSYQFRYPQGSNMVELNDPGD